MSEAKSDLTGRARAAEAARTMRRLGATLACAALGAGGPRATPAATTILTVSVGDAASGAFIVDAQVRLPSAGRVSRTAWNGEARFAGLSSGRYHIEVRAIGYAPGDIDMPVRGDSAAVLFNLERITTALDTVRVVAAQAPRAARGLKEFEERRRAGIGRFFTDTALIEHRAQGLRLFLAIRVPGLRGCPVWYYLDGFRVKEFDPDAFRLEELAGIEVYSRISAPVQYKPLGDYCRVILLWTKW